MTLIILASLPFLVSLLVLALAVCTYVLRNSAVELCNHMHENTRSLNSLHNETENLRMDMAYEADVRRMRG